MITLAKEYWDTWTGGIYTPEQIMIEFAKFHVKAALEAAANDAEAYIETDESGLAEYCTAVIDKGTILYAYPLENIK